jgi:hypothetical protein
MGFVGRHIHYTRLACRRQYVIRHQRFVMCLGAVVSVAVQRQYVIHM